MVSQARQAHIVMCPGSGMGHLNPFLRLASQLSALTPARITLVVIRPAISAAEAEHVAAFLSSHPHVHPSEFRTLPSDDDPAIPPGSDPFLLKYAAICRSAGRLAGHVASLSPPPTAVFSDIMLASGLNGPLAALPLPNFTLITTSARFLSFMACLPMLPDGETELPNPIPDDDVPGGPVRFFRAFPFLRLMETNYKALHQATGVVVNTFLSLEPGTLRALEARAVEDVPPVFPLGPLAPLGAPGPRGDEGPEPGYLRWLEGKPRSSVAYVSFGSRTAVSDEQIRELAAGLEASGAGFLWVVKTSIVDKQEGQWGLGGALGEGFEERTKGRGMVVRGWVDQDRVLAHPSVGGFVTHCGWNSVTEAALRGVPLLAWPRQDEQRVNASVAHKAGLGAWDPSWGWGGQLVGRDAIAEKVRELMNSHALRESAWKVGEAAAGALAHPDGSSRQALRKLLRMCGTDISTPSTQLA